MARKSTITAEAVAAAIAEIQGRGGRVTLIDLRKQLGGGSFSTITPFYQAWEKAQAESATLAEVEVPDQLALSGEEWLAKIWKIAVDAASAGHEGLRRELVEAREATEQARADGAEMVAVIETERDQVLEQVEELNAQAVVAKTDAAALLSRAVDAERDLAAARERAMAADARADRSEADRAAALDRAGRVEAEVVQFRDALAAMRETVAKLTAEGAALADQLKAATGAAMAADARATKAEARSDKSEARAEAVQAELTKTGADLSTARADLATERAQHGATRSQLSERLERLSVDLERAEDQVKTLAVDLAAAKAARVKIEARADALAAELAEVRKTEKK